LDSLAGVYDFKALIDGKVLQASIKEKEEAKNKYDDAIGNSTVCTQDTHIV
jgi:hypothetical protein